MLLAVAFGLSIVIAVGGVEVSRQPSIELAYTLKLFFRAVASFVSGCAFAMLFNNSPRTALAAGLLAPICAKEYRGAADSIFVSATPSSAGGVSGRRVLASCSNCAMRETLIPGGPSSRIAVNHSLPQRTLTVMLSSETIADTASKHNFGAIASIHLRVRTAVLPACSIKMPKRNRTSSVSIGATELVLSKVEVTRSQYQFAKCFCRDGGHRLRFNQGLRTHRNGVANIVHRTRSYPANRPILERSLDN
jgi:hypothetical protein